MTCSTPEGGELHTLSPEKVPTLTKLSVLNVILFSSTAAIEATMLISGVDWQPTAAKQRQFDRLVQIARDWFERHRPPDAPVLPIGYDERERLKKGMGLLSHMVAWYARSVACRNYDFLEHPSFCDYACGVMGSKEHTPSFMRNDEEMRRLSAPSVEWTGNSPMLGATKSAARTAEGVPATP